MIKWNRFTDMEDTTVKRWLESDEGDIISIVTGSPSVLRCIDGEMRCSLGTECFMIPCSLNVVEKKSDDELIKVAERRYKMILEVKQR